MVRRAFILFAVLTSGCFEVEQTIELRRNLSGTASMDFNLDMKPMVTMMAYIQKSMATGGEAKEVTAQEIESARKKFLGGQATELRERITRSGAELKRRLPPGVELRRYTPRNKDLRFGLAALLSFDHVKKLGDIQLEDAAQNADPISSGPASSGIVGGLVVEEDAKSLTLSTTLEGPSSGARGLAGLVDGEDGLDQLPDSVRAPMRAATKRLKMKISFKAPLKVLEHNATRQLGDTLVWTFDYDSIKTSQASGEPLAIRVRYAK